MLERRGLRDREWAVEWEASALEFLLEKGFSPEMGARPLKRAIDQYLLAPLAATIVEQRFPEGDQFLFVRSDGTRDPGRVRRSRRRRPAGDRDHPGQERGRSRRGADAARDDPRRDRDAGGVAGAGGGAGAHQRDAGLGGLGRLPGPAGGPHARARFLVACRSPPDAGAARPDGPGQDGSRHRGVPACAPDQGHAAGGQVLARTGGAAGAATASRRARHRRCVRGGADRGGADGRAGARASQAPARPMPAIGACKVLDMYRAWAASRHMQLTEIARPQRRLPWLLISGFGAHRVLSAEAGLHVLESESDDDGTDRQTARVRIAAAPLGDLSADRVRVHVQAEFDRLPASMTIVRRYREVPSPLVRQIAGAGWRTGRLDAVLRGDFDLIAAAQA